MNNTNIQEQAYSYSSTQVNIEEPLRSQILEFNKTFISEEDLADDGRESIPHITVKYGLNEKYPYALIGAIKLVKPIKVVLGKTSIFNKSPDYDVVKIDVLSKDLRNLNKLIKNAVDSTDTFKIYSPHLTLGYVLKGLGAKYVGNATFEGKQMIFNKIYFSSMDGDYTIIYLNEDNIVE